jgi:hypothetical protein
MRLGASDQDRPKDREATCFCMTSNCQKNVPVYGTLGSDLRCLFRGYLTQLQSLRRLSNSEQTFGRRELFVELDSWLLRFQQKGLLLVFVNRLDKLEKSLLVSLRQRRGPCGLRRLELVPSVDDRHPVWN